MYCFYDRCRLHCFSFQREVEVCPVLYLIIKIVTSRIDVGHAAACVIFHVGRSIIGRIRLYQGWVGGFSSPVVRIAPGTTFVIGIDLSFVSFVLKTLGFVRRHFVNIRFFQRWIRFCYCCYDPCLGRWWIWFLSWNAFLPLNHSFVVFTPLTTSPAVCRWNWCSFIIMPWRFVVVIARQMPNSSWN